MTKDPALTYLDDLLDNLKEMFTTDNLLALDSPIDMMLDHHGSLFGIKRLPKEINQDYRSRIVITLIERQGNFIKSKEIVDKFTKHSDEAYDALTKVLITFNNPLTNTELAWWGETWGIHRLDKETNDDYRKRVIIKIKERN